MIELTINGETKRVEAPDNKPLLWVLRENFKLRGAKYSCGQGMCGACTVLVDGNAVRSCVTPISSLDSKSVLTIEGLNDTLGVSLKEAWRRLRVAQCGYCQSGQIMAAYSLFTKRERRGALTEDEGLTNLCRCGTYTRIRQALNEVAESTQSGGE